MENVSSPARNVAALRGRVRTADAHGIPQKRGRTAHYNVLAAVPKYLSDQLAGPVAFSLRVGAILKIVR